MVIPYAAFIILLVWSLYDGDLYPREGGFLIGIMIVSYLAFLLLKLSFAWYLVTAVLTDIYMIVKVFGGDVQIR